MKKILVSLSIIAAAAAVIVGATTAYFSDTETSTGNTITSGTVDISAGDSFEQGVEITDMKPSYVRFIEFDVTNVGTNPLRLWKHIKNIDTDENGVVEPEKQWYDEHGLVRNDIDTVIEYDMYLGGEIKWDDNTQTTGHVEGGDVVIDEDDGITLSDIESHYIYIGDLKQDETKHIIQSYHMATDTENWAQSDTLSFDIELLALQLNAPGPADTTLLMENKDGQWNRITGDGMYGILTYQTEKDTFDYAFEGRGLQANTNYSLIYYADPWAGNNPGALIGTMTTDSNGDVSVAAGSKDLGIDLPDPADANYADGAKIWLVPSNNYDATNKKMSAWNPTQYLFEYNLVKYDDTNN